MQQNSNSNITTKSVNDDLPKSNYNLVDEWSNDESLISDDSINCSCENHEIIDDHSNYNNIYDVNNLLLPPANRQFVTVHNKKRIKKCDLDSPWEPDTTK